MAKLKKRAARVLRDYLGWAQTLRQAVGAPQGGAETNGHEPGPDAMRLHWLVALEAAVDGWERLKGKDEHVAELLEMEEHRHALCRLARRTRRFRAKGLGRERSAYTPDLERWADHLMAALASALDRVGVPEPEEGGEESRADAEKAEEAAVHA